MASKIAIFHHLVAAATRKLILQSYLQNDLD